MAASTTNGAAAGKGFLIVDFDIKNMKLCYAWENTREQVDVDTLKGTELVVLRTKITDYFLPLPTALDHHTTGETVFMSLLENRKKIDQMFGLFDVNAFQMYRMDFPGKPEFERGVSGAREKMVSLKDEHEVAWIEAIIVRSGILHPQ